MENPYLPLEYKERLEAMTEELTQAEIDEIVKQVRAMNVKPKFWQSVQFLATVKLLYFLKRINALNVVTEHIDDSHHMEITRAWRIVLFRVMYKDR